MCRTAGGAVLRAMAAALALVLFPLFAHAQDEDDAPFAGRYAGFGASEGVVASLAESGQRVVGHFTDADGHVYTVNGHISGEGAEGALLRGQERAFFHLERRPLGILFMQIPADAAGEPDLDAARQLALAREDVNVDVLLGKSQRPSQRQPAPSTAFLNDPSGRDLADRYAALPPRVRELVRLFDHVQANLTGRLCAAVEAGQVAASHEAVRLALERQQAGCSAIATLRSRAAQSDAWEDFETRLAVQQDLLVTTLACDSGERDAETCQTAGAMNAAMFEQWRRAPVIFAEIADAGGTGSASVVTDDGPISLRGSTAESSVVVTDAERGGGADVPVPQRNPRR